MRIANTWKDYQLVDCSNGEKLERWGNIYLLRPDPQIIWNHGNLLENHKEINAVYYRSNKGGGHWENLKSTPSMWKIKYKHLTFCIKQMGFKHTGLFPEQAVNWDFCMEKIEKANRQVKVLNLFAYTGAASVACLSKGASVVHVDSSRGMNEWAKENVKASHLENAPIRFIVDYVLKFVKREARRGNKYDAIIMDPPSYGKGANGEIWDIEKDLDPLICACMDILVDEPLFFLINSYTTGLSSSVLGNLLKIYFKDKKGKIDTGEIGLPIENSTLVLPCGIYGRYQSND